MSDAPPPTLLDAGHWLRHLTLAAERLRSRLPGLARSSRRGSGLEFLDLRPYTAGDDVRAIDWRASARMNEPFVRQFEEETDRRLAVFFDRSPSMMFDTQGRTKFTQATELAGLLALLTIGDGGRTTWATPSRTTPPLKTSVDVLRAVARSEDRPPTQTSVTDLLAAPGLIRQKPSVVVLFTDFFFDRDRDTRRTLTAVSRRHDVRVVCVYAPAERSLPDAGLVRFSDPTGRRRRVIDTASPAVRADFATAARQRRRDVREFIERTGCQFIEAAANDDPAAVIAQHFTRQAGR